MSLNVDKMMQVSIVLSCQKIKEQQYFAIFVAGQAFSVALYHTDAITMYIVLAIIHIRPIIIPMVYNMKFSLKVFFICLFYMQPLIASG